MMNCYGYMPHFLSGITDNELRNSNFDVCDKKIMDALKNGNKDLSIKSIKEAIEKINSSVEKVISKAKDELQKSGYKRVDTKKDSAFVLRNFLTGGEEYYVKEKLKKGSETYSTVIGDEDSEIENKKTSEVNKRKEEILKNLLGLFDEKSLAEIRKIIESSKDSHGSFPEIKLSQLKDYLPKLYEEHIEEKMKQMKTVLNDKDIKILEDATLGDVKEVLKNM